MAHLEKTVYSSIAPVQPNSQEMDYAKINSYPLSILRKPLSEWLTICIDHKKHPSGWHVLESQVQIINDDELEAA